MSDVRSNEELFWVETTVTPAGKKTAAPPHISHRVQKPFHFTQRLALHDLAIEGCQVDVSLYSVDQGIVAPCRQVFSFAVASLRMNTLYRIFVPGAGSLRAARTKADSSHLFGEGSITRESSLRSEVPHLAVTLLKLDLARARQPLCVST